MTRDEANSDYFVRSLLLGRPDLVPPAPPPSLSWWQHFWNALAGRAGTEGHDSARHQAVAHAPGGEPGNAAERVERQRINALEEKIRVLDSTVNENAVQQADELHRLRVLVDNLQVRLTDLQESLGLQGEATATPTQSPSFRPVVERQRESQENLDRTTQHPGGNSEDEYAAPGRRTSRGPLPQLTEEPRRRALAKAVEARRVRAEVNARLKRGGLSMAEVLEQSDTDDMLGSMRVSALLEAMPGVGKVRAAQIMERLEIAPSRRLRELGRRQRRALLADFEP